jgi:hypothetical protein
MVSVVPVSVPIPIVVSVMVAVIVTPRPVFFLLFRREFSEVSVPVTMSFIGPAIVIDDFVIVPRMVVGVIRIINAVRMVLGASDTYDGGRQRGGQQYSHSVRTTTHVFLLQELKHSR